MAVIKRDPFKGSYLLNDKLCLWGCYPNYKTMLQKMSRKHLGLLNINRQKGKDITKTEEEQKSEAGTKREAEGLLISWQRFAQAWTLFLCW